MWLFARQYLTIGDLLLPTENKVLKKTQNIFLEQFAYGIITDIALVRQYTSLDGIYRYEIVLDF